MTLVISFFHGRHSKDQEMDGWGFDGPKLKLQTFAYTYGSYRIFNHNDCEIDLNDSGGLIEIDGKYYGDFHIWDDAKWDESIAVNVVMKAGTEETVFKGIAASVDDVSTSDNAWNVVIFEPEEEEEEHVQMECDARWIDEFKPIMDDQNSCKHFSGAEIVGVDPAKVWTLIEGDEGLYIVNGPHYVNRLEYFITELPAKPNTTYEIVWMLNSDLEDENDG